jgi:molybdenum cofactor synthesis domain-containing protein
LEIICVGNELLIGKTLNTNAQWLARRVTSLGLKVRRITVVSDEIDEIAMAVRETVQRRPSFVITTGGLGPTFDDKTLEGVAAGFNHELEENKESLKMIKEKYRSYVAEGRIEKFEMTPHRVKMARLPKGAKPLPNRVGTAPGVLMEHEGIKLVMLPGVPKEMVAIFEESAASLLRKVAGDLTFYETSLEVREMPESELAPIIDHVMRDNPYVYVKSHPKAAEKAHHLEVHLSTTSKDSKIARQRIGRAIVQISEMIREKGGKVKLAKA